MIDFIMLIWMQYQLEKCLHITQVESDCHSSTKNKGILPLFRYILPTTAFYFNKRFVLNVFCEKLENTALFMNKYITQERKI